MRRPLPWVIGCSVALAVLVTGYVVARSRDRRDDDAYLCFLHLRSLGLACAMYTSDYDGKLPSGMKQFADYACRQPFYGHSAPPAGPPVFHCPLDPDQKELRTITNTALDGDDSARCSYDCRFAYPPMPAEADHTEPLMWDIDGGDPTSPRANRHRSAGNVLFFAGIVILLPSTDWPAGNRPPALNALHRG